MDKIQVKYVGSFYDNPHMVNIYKIGNDIVYVVSGKLKSIRTVRRNGTFLDTDYAFYQTVLSREYGLKF